VTLRRPDGTTMTSSKGCGVPFDLPTQTLPVPGQYTIFVDPEREATGVVDVSVTSP